MSKSGYWTQDEIDALDKLRKFNIHLSLSLPWSKKNHFGHRGVLSWTFHAGSVTYVKWTFTRIYRGFGFSYHRISFLIGWR